MFNKATAPVIGTDTPVLNLALKPTDQFTFDYGDLGLQFAAGIGFAITGAAADLDATALLAADIVGLNLIYA